MEKKYVNIIVALFGLFCLCGQFIWATHACAGENSTVTADAHVAETAPAPKHQSTAAAPHNHFLWVVHTGKNKIYLLGSIHVLKQDAYPLPAALEQAYLDSQIIVFEANPQDMQRSDIQALFLEKGTLPERDSLKNHLSDQSYKSLETHLAASGLSIAQFDRFRPWFCALTLLGIEFIRLGFDPGHGIDQYFFRKATSDKKQKAYLETAEFQLNLFTGLSENDQQMFLNQMLKDLGILEKEMAKLLRSWQTGDGESLNAILKESFKDYPDIYDQFVVQRNKNWALQIENFAKQTDNVLAIVGSLHLVGENSLVDLLRQKGYDVVQK